MSTLNVKSQSRKDSVYKQVIAGGVAGMCSKTAIAPLDRIKILLQAHNDHYKHLGVFSGLKEIINRESFRALYKGNFAQMVRVFPYSATQFTAFEYYKKQLSSMWKVHRSRKASDVNFAIAFIAGSGAGVTAVTLTFPLDTIRARLAFQVTGEHIYGGILHTAYSMFKEEGGLRGMYRGFLPTIVGMIPYAGFSFYTFARLKAACWKYFPHQLCYKNDKSPGGFVLTVPGNLLCGGAAGAIAQTFSYPFDVTRRRMQLGVMNPDTFRYSTSMYYTLWTIYRENGVIRGLYRGMSINYLRAIPMVAVSFATYEVMKQVFDLNTETKI